MIRTFKVKLCPNNKQRTKLLQNAGVSRFAYNWALGYQKSNHESGGKFLSDCDLRKVFTQLKQTEEYHWLNAYSNNLAKLSDRVYVCSECGNTIDRDLQAAINLKNYAQSNIVA